MTRLTQLHSIRLVSMNLKHNHSLWTDKPVYLTKEIMDPKPKVESGKPKLESGKELIKKVPQQVIDSLMALKGTTTYEEESTKQGLEILEMHQVFPASDKVDFRLKFFAIWRHLNVIKKEKLTLSKFAGQMTSVLKDKIDKEYNITRDGTEYAYGFVMNYPEDNYFNETMLLVFSQTIKISNEESSLLLFQTNTKGCLRLRGLCLFKESQIGDTEEAIKFFIDTIPAVSTFVCNCDPSLVDTVNSIRKTSMINFLYSKHMIMKYGEKQLKGLFHSTLGTSFMDKVSKILKIPDISDVNAEFDKEAQEIIHKVKDKSNEKVIKAFLQFLKNTVKLEY